MFKKRWIVLYILTFVLVSALAVKSQVKNPDIPRFWWDSVKDYICSKSESKILSFIHYGTPTDQVLGIFTPENNVIVQRIDIYARSLVAGDTTAFILTNGVNSSIVVMDSSSSVNRWIDTAEVIFGISQPCTLRFSDDNYTGTFSSGADTPMVVIQYKIAD